jgi:hypothetical protein
MVAGTEGPVAGGKPTMHNQQTAEMSVSTSGSEIEWCEAQTALFLALHAAARWQRGGGPAAICEVSEALRCALAAVSRMEELQKTRHPLSTARDA